MPVILESLLSDSNRRLLWQCRLSTILCQEGHPSVFLDGLIVRLRHIILERLALAGVEVCPLFFLLFRCHVALCPSMAVGVGMGISAQRRVVFMDDGQRLCITVVIELCILTHATATVQRLCLLVYLAIAEGTVVFGGLLLSLPQELFVVLSRLWQFSFLGLAKHDDLQTATTDAAEHEYRLWHLDGLRR